MAASLGAKTIRFDKDSSGNGGGGGRMLALDAKATSVLRDLRGLSAESIVREEEVMPSGAAPVLTKTPSFVKQRTASSRYQLESQVSGLDHDRNRETIMEDALGIGEDALASMPRFTIHPQSSRKIAWDVVVSLLIFYSVIVIPYRIGFGLEAEGFAYGFDWFVDGMFFLDMAASSLTAFWLNDELETRRGRILRNYLRGWFIIDLVSTLPVDLMLGPLFAVDAAADDGGPGGASSGGASADALRSIKLIKFFRLVRLIKLARLLKLRKFGGSLEGAFRLNPALQRLLKLLLQIIFVAHLLACFWFFTSTLDDSSDDNWVVAHGLADDDIDTQYLASFYWTVATMMAVGYGDIHAVNNVEKAYSILVQVTGATSFGFIIANISAFLETFDPKASAYRTRMDRLKQYMRDRELPRRLQRRVRKYYDYILTKESIFDDQSILAQLPSHLMENIILHVHGTKAKGIDFLRYEDSSFVAYIMARSKVLLALSGEVVCEQESVGTHIYVILQGRVEGIVVEYAAAEDAAPVFGASGVAVKEIEGAEEESGGKVVVRDHSLTDLSSEASQRSLAREPSLGKVKAAQDKAAAIPAERVRQLHRQGSAESGSSDGSAAATQAGRTRGNKRSSKKKKQGKQIKHAVVAGIYNRGANFGEVGVIRAQPHEVTFRANRTCDLLSVDKDHMDYAIYLYPTSALRFRKRCDRHAELMEASIAASTEFFPFSDRHIKAVVTVGGTSHQTAAAVERGLGPLVLSAMVAHDVTGRFQSVAQREQARRSQRATQRAASSQLGGFGGVAAGGRSLLAALGGSQRAGNGANRAGPVVRIVRSSVKVRRQSAAADAGPRKSAMPATNVLGSSSSSSSLSPSSSSFFSSSSSRTSSVKGSRTSAGASKLAKVAPVNVGELTTESPKRQIKTLQELKMRSPTVLLVTKEEGVHCEDTEMEVEAVLRELWVIPPNLAGKLKWDLLLGALIVYSVLTVPYRIGFSQPATGAAAVFDVLVDVLFFLDMAVTFRTGYETTDDDVLVVVPRLIAGHYLKGWFAVDFLSTFPFDSVLALLLVDNDGEALRSLKLIKVFRMIRLLKLVRLLKLKKLLGNLDMEVEFSPGLFKLSTLFLQITFVAHLFACFWFYASSQSAQESQKWYVAAGLSPNDEDDVEDKYISSLYWSFTTMTTVGYGDVAPTTNHERFYAIFIMIMGATIFGYVVGSIASLISMLDIADALYKAKMTELGEYLSEQGIPKALRRECKSCYAYSLSLKSVFDERSLLAALSPSLRHEILITIHQVAVDTLPIFHDQTSTFIADLLSAMHPQLALPNTFVVRNDDLGSLIYFIVSGEVLVYEDEWPEANEKGAVTFDKAKLFRHKAGNFFGHEAVLSGKRHAVNARSLKLTQLYILSKAAIGELVDKTPPFALILQSVLRKAIRRQDVALGKVDPAAGDLHNNRRPKLWSLVQNHFNDILSMSPSQMRHASGQATNVTKLEELINQIQGKSGNKLPGGFTSTMRKLKKEAKREDECLEVSDDTSCSLTNSNSSN